MPASSIWLQLDLDCLGVNAPPVRVELHAPLVCMGPEEAQVLPGPGPAQEAEGQFGRDGEDQVDAPAEHIVVISECFTMLPSHSLHENPARQVLRCLQGMGNFMMV